jgi:hypothetical protein
MELPMAFRSDDYLASSGFASSILAAPGAAKHVAP